MSVIEVQEADVYLRDMGASSESLWCALAQRPPRPAHPQLEWRPSFFAFLPVYPCGVPLLGSEANTTTTLTPTVWRGSAGIRITAVQRARAHLRNLSVVAASIGGELHRGRGDPVEMDLRRRITGEEPASASWFRSVPRPGLLGLPLSRNWWTWCSSVGVNWQRADWNIIETFI